MKQRLYDLFRVLVNSFVLFEYRPIKAVGWVLKKNQLFNGFSPWTYTLGGRGEFIYKWQETTLGNKSPFVKQRGQNGKT